MKESTKQYLINKYNEIPVCKTSAICLKYYYKYKGVNVNVYFDAFDIQSVSLSIVLVAERKFYYTALNILNTGSESAYLNEIPREILNKILVDNQLTEFYINMEEHICNGTPRINYYNEDKIFTKTIKYAKNRVDLPFWQTVRRVPMSEDTICRLNKRADITLETLREIQDRGLTLVRTADPSKRRELTLILENYGIKLT